MNSQQPSRTNDDDDNDSLDIVMGSPPSDFESESMDGHMNVDGAGPDLSSLTPSLLGMRILWDGSDDVPLEEWIKEIKPSYFSGDQSISPFCHWIQINNPRSTSFGYYHPPADLSKYERLLDELSQAISVANGNANPPTTTTTTTMTTHEFLSRSKQQCIQGIMDLARQDDCLSGKWLIFVQAGKWLDRIWESIAMATGQGRLGCSSKVSPTKQHLGDHSAPFGCAPPRPEGVICVYVEDSSDRTAIQRVLEVLKRGLPISGIEVSGFKPDIFTELGIYSGNPWGLRTSLYTAAEVEAWD